MARDADYESAIGQTKQISLVDPVEKIRRVFEMLEGHEFDVAKLNMSGGRDSFLAAEAVRRIGSEYGITADFACHFSTGTNIPSTTQLVQEYCAEHGLPYVEGMNKTPKEMAGPQALDYGQYGAGEGRVVADRKHATAYVLRKERVEEGFYRGFVGDILVISGTYHDESESRGAKMSDGAVRFGETGKRKPRMTVASPIYALTEDEVDDLAEKWDVPKAPAYGLTGSSGDCTMCAYDQAGRFANLWQEAPYLAFCQATLMVWIQLRRRAGHLNLPPERVLWGWGSLSEDAVEALREEDTLYDPKDDDGPTSVEAAATIDEADDEEQTRRDPEPVDHELKEFTCSDCDERCEPAFPVAVTDGGRE